MNHKVWLITYGVLAALLAIGGGLFAFSGYREYSDAMMSWDDRVGVIQNLESRVPYPNSDNSEALEKRVEEYEESVQGLYETLETFQRPLNTELSSTEFQQLVKTRVQSFRGAARDGGLEIEEASEFQLGFDRYSNVIPPQGIVPVLDYELEAIDRLLRTLIEAGVERLISFERDPIPGEDGVADQQDSRVVHRYPVRLRFVGDHDAFQNVINQLANDKGFFYVVRVMKVSNSMKEGPIKLSASDTGVDLPQFQNPNTKEYATFEMLTEWGMGSVSEEELAARAKEAGFVSSKEDARILMGQEKLTVFMVVDITRFLSPGEVAADGETQTTNEGTTRNR